MADYVELWHQLFYSNPLFIRAVQDWEVDFVAKLLKDLYEIKIWYGNVDKLVWLPSQSKGFHLKSDYNILRGGGGGGGESKFSVEKHLDSLCLTKGGFLFMVWCQGGFDSWEFKEKGQNFHRMVLHV